MPKMKQEPQVAPPSAPLLGNFGPVPDDIPDTFPVPPSLAAEAMDADTPGVPPEAPTTAQEPAGGSTPPAMAATIPPVPDGLLPLAHGFCQYVQAQLTAQLTDAGVKMARDVDKTITAMADYTKGVLASNEHASYQISDALLKIMEHGFTISGAPYTATVSAVNTDGFTVTLTIQKHEASSLVEELQRLLPWMQGQGFTGVAVCP